MDRLKLRVNIWQRSVARSNLCFSNISFFFVIAFGFVLWPRIHWHAPPSRISLPDFWFITAEKIYENVERNWNFGRTPEKWMCVCVREQLLNVLYVWPHNECGRSERWLVRRYFWIFIGSSNKLMPNWEQKSAQYDSMTMELSALRVCAERIFLIITLWLPPPPPITWDVRIGKFYYSAINFGVQRLRNANHSHNDFYCFFFYYFNLVRSRGSPVGHVVRRCSCCAMRGRIEWNF